MGKKKYHQAINEAFFQIMERNKDVYQIGVGLNTPWYVGHTMNGLLDHFGEEKIIDSPVSENGVTGVAIGSAVTGMRPILTFPRMDFMHYAMDQICNHCAIMNFTLGGHVSVPITIRAIINRGGEQAAQHSQALQGIFMHIPGIKIVMPSDPYDAKGLLIAAVEDNNPVIYIDDRWLYEVEGEVPDTYYTVPIGKAKTLRRGNDVTLVATSYMVVEAEKACRELEKEGISVELIDLRSIKPIDAKTILDSVSQTGCLVIADAGWKTAGVAAEISALVASEGFESLRYPIQRVTLPDVPAPASSTLEQEFYPSYRDIIKTITQTLERGK